MHYNFISIEGNIGAGKTTLSKLLAEAYNGNLILEQYADNPFLPKFYKEPQKYAFQLELSFLADRFRQMKKDVSNRNIFQQVLISDYLFIKSKLFAKVNLPEDEYQLFETLFDIIYPNLPQPDLLIFLHAPISTLKSNIKTRNRAYEQDIPNVYLEKIQNMYNAYLNTVSFPVLLIDSREVDFLNKPAHFAYLQTLLLQKFEVGKHYISFD